MNYNNQHLPPYPPPKPNPPPTMLPYPPYSTDSIQSQHSPERQSGYGYQYQHYQYQQHPYPMPYSSTNNYHNNYYIHNNGTIQAMGLDNNSNNSNVRSREDQMTNPMMIIERTLINQSESWRGIFTPNAFSQRSDQAQNNSNQLSMTQILRNIERECSEPKQEKPQLKQGNQQKLKLMAREQMQVPHENPIYSKISKYMQKLARSKTSEQRSMASSNNNNNELPNPPTPIINPTPITNANINVNVDGKKQIGRQEPKIVIIADNQFKIGKSKIKKNSSLNSEDLFEKVQSVYEIKKIHTDSSEDPVDYIPIKQEGRQLRLSPLATVQAANIHKNIRNKIIASSKPSFQVTKSDIGIQVDALNLQSQDQNRLQVNKETIGISNMKEISEILPMERDRNLDSICLPFDFRDIPEVVIKLQESIYQIPPPKKAKTLHNKFGNLDESGIKNNGKDSSNKIQSRSAMVKANEKPSLVNFRHLESIQSINTDQHDENGSVRQSNWQRDSLGVIETMVIQESSQMYESYAESEVMEKSTIKYKTIYQSKQENQQQSPQQQESPITNDQGNMHMNIPKLPKQSPTHAYQQNLSIKFTQSKEEPLLYTCSKDLNKKEHLPTSLTASKLANVIASFSELKQLIDFEFKEFQHYIKDWVDSIIREYEAVLMEKEECIFVLQLEKISLEDQLREATQRNAQSLSRSQQNIKKVATREPPMLPISQSQTRRSKSKKAQLKFEQRGTWKQLNDLEEILSAQIYKIEAERDKQFNEVIHLQATDPQ